MGEERGTLTSVGEILGSGQSPNKWTWGCHGSLKEEGGVPVILPQLSPDDQRAGQGAAGKKVTYSRIPILVDGSDPRMRKILKNQGATVDSSH